MFKKRPTSSTQKLFPSTSLGRFWHNLLAKPLRLRKLERQYAKLRPSESPQQFLRQALEVLNIDYETNADANTRIPETGPLVVVCNHPFGAIDGLMIADFVLNKRQDTKLLAGRHWSLVGELRELLIAVSPFGGSQPVKQSLVGLRNAIRWVNDQGALIVFPAGRAARFRLKNSRIVDDHWHPSVARIIQRTQANVLPIHISGKHGALYRLLGFMHPRLRSFMLAHELLNKDHGHLHVHVGRLMPFKRLKHYASAKELTDYLRLHTLSLAPEDPTQHVEHSEQSKAARIMPHRVPIAEATPKDTLCEAIERLPESQKLAENKQFIACVTTMSESPTIIEEIGRIREVTFRAAGAGTGAERDLDPFDDVYQHLFIFDREQQCIVGGYRLGFVDQIIKQHGKRMLYSASLFDLSDTLIKRINPAIELGRSFVAPDYQKSFLPLKLLWLGIGKLLEQNPHYYNLFGSVGIHNSYRTGSQQLMVAFMQANAFDDDLAKHVKARNPFMNERQSKRAAKDMQSIKSIDDISNLVGELEPDQKGVPVLMRQYLKLGSEFLGFHVDKEFSSLACLLKVDVRKTDRKILERYMGKDTATNYLAHHFPLDVAK